MAPRAVDHIHIRNFKSIAPNQCRKKPMQAVKIRQGQERRPPKHLEAASGICGTVVQHRTTRRIGDLRLQAFEAARLAADALPCHQPDSADYWRGPRSSWEGKPGHSGRRRQGSPRCRRAPPQPRCALPPIDRMTPDGKGRGHKGEPTCTRPVRPPCHRSSRHPHK